MSKLRLSLVPFLMLALTLLWSGCDLARSSDTPTATLSAQVTRSTSPTLTATPAPSPTVQALDGATSAEPPPMPASPAPLQPLPVSVAQLPDIASVVERARPAVVSVVVEVLRRDFFGRTLRDTQSGSGVIFDPEGYILTNNHVVQGYRAVTVTMDDGTQFEAEVVGTDRLSDLAVLKLEGRGFAAAPLGEPTSVRVGDWVIAIGNALALPGGPTVTVGVISALDRPFEVEQSLTLYGLIQTDASINPGNSGGPLLNLQGQVVGINTAVARGDKQGRDIEGIGFAVGMDTASSVAQQLIESGRVKWAYLGVGLGELTPDLASRLGVPIREGVVVTQIFRDTPATAGGLRAGDVIVSFGGQKVSTSRKLIGLLRHGSDAGDVVELEVFRENEEITLEVTLGERPSS